MVPRTLIEMMVDRACGFDPEQAKRDNAKFQDDLERMKAELFDFIKHGDENHQAWLREAIDAYFGGGDRPPPR